MICCVPQSVGQPQDRKVSAAATGNAAVWGTISLNIMSEVNEPQTAAGQALSTTDTLKIAHTLDIFR